MRLIRERLEVNPPSCLSGDWVPGELKILVLVGEMFPPTIEFEEAPCEINPFENPPNPLGLGFCFIRGVSFWMLFLAVDPPPKLLFGVLAVALIIGELSLRKIWGCGALRWPICSAPEGLWPLERKTIFSGDEFSWMELETTGWGSWIKFLSSDLLTSSPSWISHAIWIFAGLLAIILLLVGEPVSPFAEYIACESWPAIGTIWFFLSISALKSSFAFDSCCCFRLWCIIVIVQQTISTKPETTYPIIGPTDELLDSSFLSEFSSVFDDTQDSFFEESMKPVEHLVHAVLLVQMSQLAEHATQTLLVRSK